MRIGIVLSFAFWMSTGLLTSAALADARLDSAALLEVSTDASAALAEVTDGWNGTASLDAEAQLRRTVLEPLEEAINQWFDAGMKFGGGDNNPYRQYMACHDGAYELRLQAIQLIHFNGGRLTADKVKLDHIAPAMTKLDACLVALKN